MKFLLFLIGLWLIFTGHFILGIVIVLVSLNLKGN